MANGFAPLKPEKTPMQRLEEQHERERTALLRRIDTSEGARKEERKRRKSAETERDALKETAERLKQQLKKRKREEEATPAPETQDRQQQQQQLHAARRHLRTVLLKTHPDHHTRGDLDRTALTQDLNQLLAMLTGSD